MRSRLTSIAIAVAATGLLLTAGTAQAEPDYSPYWNPNYYGPEWTPGYTGPEWDPNNAKFGTADILEGLVGWLH
nr:hypothetical protein [Kibdelosporangium sp. MJ126-NF4]CEL18692.1 hypothetical protein [Kibdelosporangium sp. MJ126-NF4]CTQ98176.1 hypothetical protein [Kibdelosporangium sp. MJ126-NF4]